MWIWSSVTYIILTDNCNHIAVINKCMFSKVMFSENYTNAWISCRIVKLIFIVEVPITMSIPVLSIVTYIFTTCSYVHLSLNAAGPSQHVATEYPWVMQWNYPQEKGIFVSVEIVNAHVKRLGLSSFISLTNCTEFVIANAIHISIFYLEVSNTFSSKTIVAFLEVLLSVSNYCDYSTSDVLNWYI